MAYNQNVARFRVPVEQFFGRVLQLWAVPRNVYRWEHKHLQLDFENFCLLTNTHIKVNTLEGIDFEFYQKLLTLRIKKAEDQSTKQKDSQKRSTEKKKRKLESITPI